MPALVLLVICVIAIAAVAVVYGRPPPARGKGPVKMNKIDRARRAKRVGAVLMAGAGVLLVLGFTQFRFLEDTSASVVLVLDVSESMSRDDVEPTRLRAAKDAASAFLVDLPDDLRVGLVTFAAEAQLLVPPTIEHQEVEAGLSDLPRGEGTVIGDGIARSLDAIAALWDEKGESPAAIIVLSDGRDTGSLVHPDDAAARAAEQEIPVYTVVLGGDVTGTLAGANIELMRRIAETTGGTTFTATTAGGLIDVYLELQEELSIELDITNFGSWFVGVAALLALAATVAILVVVRAEY